MVYTKCKCGNKISSTFSGELHLIDGHIICPKCWEKANKKEFTPTVIPTVEPSTVATKTVVPKVEEPIKKVRKPWHKKDEPKVETVAATLVPVSEPKEEPTLVF